MRTIRFMPDHAAYPLWFYDDSGNLTFDWTPKELTDYPEILANLDEIEAIYNSLFINNEHEFGWKGFDTEEERAEYKALVRITLTLLREKLGDKYKIIDHTHLEEV